MDEHDLTEGQAPEPEELREGGRIADVEVPAEIEESLRRERESGEAAREEEELG